MIISGRITTIMIIPGRITTIMIISCRITTIMIISGRITTIMIISGRIITIMIISGRITTRVERSAVGGTTLKKREICLLFCELGNTNEQKVKMVKYSMQDNM